MGLIKHKLLHACIYKWRIKCNRASVASEKIFDKMIGILYKTNTCLSNLIFLPLIFPPPTFMKICMFFVPHFFQNAGCFYGVDVRANRRGVFGDGRPSIVLETPKPDFWDCKLIWISAQNSHFCKSNIELFCSRPPPRPLPKKLTMAHL